MVTEPADLAPSTPEAAHDAADSGWYLYGITRREAAARAAVGADHGAPLEVLECGLLAAVVGQVPLAEFSTETLRARLEDPAWMEAMVRSHNRVIDTIHRQQAILPAKFGCVYVSVDDLKAGLERDHDGLVAHLGRLEGCDEWAVHVYVERAAIERRAANQDASMRQLRQEMASARPGRAYFLQLKLADTLAAATERALGDLAQAGYERLVRHATAGQVHSTGHPTEDARAEIEVLRAAFLVRRESEGAFVAEVNAFAASVEGLRCESSGPWPPYSFAAPTEVTLA